MCVLVEVRIVAQVFDGVIDAHGIDELAGIHAVGWIPQRLEIAEGLHQLRAKHFGQQSGAGLAVAVLAAERAAEAEHKIGGAVEELAEGAYAGLGAEVEVDAHMHAALAVVAIERTAIAVLGHERGDFAQIFAEMRGRNAGILPALPAVGLAGNEDGCAECGLTHMPDARGVGGVVDAGLGHAGPGLRGADESFGLGLRFGGIPRTHFDQQKAAAGRQQADVALCKALAMHEVDKQRVEPLKTDGAVFERGGNSVGGKEGIGKTERGEHAIGRAGLEVERGGDDGSAGALGADQRARDVEVVFRQKLVEVVAGDAARNVGELFSDLGRELVADAREAGVDFADAAALVNESSELVIAGGTNGETRAVIEDHVE